MRFSAFALLSMCSLLAFSCQKDDPTESASVYRHQVYTYSFNKGQVVGKPAYYNQRISLDSMRAVLILDEMPEQKTLLTVSLYNAPGGESFDVGVHPVDTHSWGYRPTADAAVFAHRMSGAGYGSIATDTFRSAYSFDTLTKRYNGFFVVRDLILPDTTLKIDTASSAVFPIFGTFAR